MHDGVSERVHIYVKEPSSKIYILAKIKNKKNF